MSLGQSGRGPQRGSPTRAACTTLFPSMSAESSQHSHMSSEEKGSVAHTGTNRASQNSISISVKQQLVTMQQQFICRRVAAAWPQRSLLSAPASGKILWRRL